MTFEEQAEIKKHCDELTLFALQRPFKGIMDMMTRLQDEGTRNQYARVFHAGGLSHQIVFTVLQEMGKNLGCLSIYGELRKPLPEVCDMVCRFLLPRGATDVTQAGLHDPTSRKYGGIV